MHGFTKGSMVTDNGEDWGVIICDQPDYDGQVVVKWLIVHPEANAPEGEFIYSAIHRSRLQPFLVGSVN